MFPFNRHLPLIALFAAVAVCCRRERQAWTVEAFGEDVVAVVQALDIDPVILIGHSMGGPVILEAARRMPDRVVGVVGVDTYQEFGQVYGPEEVEGFLAPLRADFPANTRTFVSSMMFLPSADSSLVNQVASDMSEAPPRSRWPPWTGWFAGTMRAAPRRWPLCGRRSVRSTPTTGPPTCKAPGATPARSRSSS